MPPEMKNADGDWVAYHAIPKKSDKNCEKAGEYHHSHAACYASCRPNYNEWDIHCVPKNGKGVISFKDASLFFDTFSELGVLPEGLKLWEDDGGVHCQIPRSDSNPHLVYVALTLYRWMDSHPPLVWEFLRIMEMPGKRHPFQILPYVICKYVDNSNHSFVTLSTWQNTTSPCNPLIGLATKLYFDPDSAFGKEDFALPNQNICISIDQITRKIEKVVKIRPIENRWGSKTLTGPKYLLTDNIDGLDPVLCELYELQNPSVRAIQKWLNAHFTEEKK